MNSVVNVRTKDYIIKNIREQILSGAFPAGMRLAQEELAEGLGVSRIPVREALQILEEQGLVDRLPSRHMVVVEITGRQVHEIFQTIAGLQYQYSQFIAESELYEEFLAALAKWDSQDEMGFHKLFCEWLDNNYLSRQLSTMLDTYVEYACQLPSWEDHDTLGILRQVRETLVQKKNQDARNLLGQYYELLEEKVTTERTRHICRA